MQSARPEISVTEIQGQATRIVTDEVVGVAGSGESTGIFDVKVYSEDKLRSLSEGGLRTLVEVSE